MSVPENQRQKSKMEVLLACDDLAHYTLTIIANEKKFDVRYGQLIGSRIADTAWSIAESAFMANEIKVGSNKELACRRQSLQNECILNCKCLIHSVGLAQRIYHIPTARMENWARKIEKARTLLQAWKESERKKIAHCDSS